MKKTLYADLSSASLDNLIKQLEQYKREFQSKVDYFLEELADVCERSLTQSFAEAVAQANAFRDESWMMRGDRVAYSVMPVTVNTERTDNGYVVTANGKDVAFLEFGAGVYADPTLQFAGNVPFSIYPGSWSNQHEGTWEKWRNSSAPDTEYPYNIQPANAFAKAYADMVTSFHHLAEEAFGE